MSELIQPPITWEAQDCVRCHVVFAAPKSFFDRLRKSGKSFFCPACDCSMSWTPGPTEAQKLREQIGSMQADMSEMVACCNRLEQEKRDLQRSRAAYKAHLTRRRKRRQGAGA